MRFMDKYGVMLRRNWYLVAEYRAGAMLVVNLLALVALGFRSRWLVTALYSVAAFFLQRRLAAGGRCTARRSLKGKTAIVTGCNTGIGYWTALRMAEQGCRILFACRSEGKAKEAIASIEQALKSTKGGDAGELVFFQLDVSSHKNVHAFVQRVENFLGKDSLDFIVNNAGGFWPAGTPRTEDGYEAHIGTNYLGPFILTEKLLPRIIASKGRIINVASIAHEWVYGLKLDSKTPYSDRVLRVHTNPNQKAPEYGLSKLCQIFHAKHLAARLQGTGATAVSLHPGAVMTEVFRRLPAPVLLAMKLGSLTNMKTPEEGAQTTLTCVFSDQVVPGAYYSDCAPRNELLKREFNVEDINALAEWSFRVTGLAPA
jgi:NAD(P)-dependent dehydrogenase (short-subunit alcohol dehydrogenase family)